MNPHLSYKRSGFGIAAALMALAVVSVVTACSPKPSAEESAAQTKVLVEQAVAEAKKEMIAEQAAEKDKQAAISAAQAEEKIKQDAAVAQAVANAKKEFAAEQRASAAKSKRLAEQRATAARPHEYSSNQTSGTASICPHCGVVLSVTEIDAEGEGSGLGVVAGGLVGGVLGNQVGAGSGRDLATIAGAVGGAFAGNKIEKIAKKTRSYDIAVKMNTGEERIFKQTAVPHVGSGDKVRIENGVVVRR
ncbi:MAG: glycine zipper 2TM domain-containing protein [Gallionella sp.]